MIHKTRERLRDAKEGSQDEDIQELQDELEFLTSKKKKLREQLLG
eukprot:CAMPEP_0114050980 /NCGR_PEP_ID=MMETSP1339-20121228/67612_1 /TAXON_ID=94617 /ORGANISM="Fibrocapsa japonica" /LENGTH=44 /assembly_acc=CAM_ASM_000762